VGTFLFLASTVMQCVQVCLYCTLSAADLVVTLETHLDSMPAAVCCFVVLGGSQGWHPFPDEARCGRSLAIFLALQALISQALYVRTGQLAALTVSLSWCASAFALAFGLARVLQPRVVPGRAVKGQYQRVVENDRDGQAGRGLRRNTDK